LSGLGSLPIRSPSQTADSIFGIDKTLKYREDQLRTGKEGSPGGLRTHTEAKYFQNGIPEML